MSRTIELSGTGISARMIKSPRAKRLSLRVSPQDGVKVTVPNQCSYDHAQKFLLEHIGWIKKQFEKFNTLDPGYITNADLIDKALAKNQLISRLSQLAQDKGFTFNRVFIRSQKTRWGSCSEKNNINLNIKLVQIPSELSDYVILHELVHTRIKNHSPRFWKELNKYTNNQAKPLDARLRNYWL